MTDDAVTRLRSLFAYTPIGQTPTDEAILRAVEGDSPPMSIEDAVQAIAGRGRGGDLLGLLSEKLGIQPPEEEQ